MGSWVSSSTTLLAGVAALPWRTGGSPCSATATAPRWEWRGSAGAWRRSTPARLASGATSQAGGAASSCAPSSTRDAVHGFLAALATQARERSLKVVQLDPPRRASRYFQHDGRLHSVQPDAFGILRRGDDLWPFFLEWERRAVRPVTMAARLAPYLRYYASRRPTDDHGTQPSVLVVFDDELAASHFLRVAREEMGRARVELPLRVSYRQLLEREGALGQVWLKPHGRNRRTPDCLPAWLRSPAPVPPVIGG